MGDQRLGVTAGEAARRRTGGRLGPISLGRDLSDRDVSPWSREAAVRPLDPSVPEAIAPDDAESAPPAPPGEPSSVNPPQRRWLITLVIALVVAASSIWLLNARVASDVASGSQLPRDVELIWTADLGAAQVIVGDDAVFAVLDDGLIAYDLDDGAERWRRPLTPSERPHALAVYDDVVVVVEQTTLTVLTLSGFDLASGDPLWSRPGPFSVVELFPDAPVEYSTPDWTTRVRIIDRQSGERHVSEGTDPVAARLPAPAHHVVARVGGRLALIDLRTSETLRPTLPEFGLRAIAPVGDVVVGLTDDADVVMFDRDGSVLDQLRFDTFGDVSGRAELVGEVPGTSIGIVASGSSIGFDVTAGAIEVVWHRSGRVGTPVVTDIGPISVMRTIDRDTGAIQVALIDARDGLTVAITDRDAARADLPMVVRDGYVTAPAIGDPSPTITARAFDGTERWSMPLPGGVEYQIAGRSLVVVGEGGTVTVYR